jgi:hypothetical protein
MKNRALFLLGIIFFPLTVSAHVNSPDIYYDGMAGPYHLLVTVRPPAVIPGVAVVEIRCDDKDQGIDQIRILPLLMSGPGAKLAPTPDIAQRSAEPQFFTGSVWLMVRGSWKVQIEVEGKNGKGELSLPVAAVPLSSSSLQWPMAVLLGGFAVLLVLGFLGIVGAANGEAQLAPDKDMTPLLRRRSLISSVLAGVLGITAVFLAYVWWGTEARAYAKTLYRLPEVKVALENSSRLALTLQNPNDTGDESTDELGRDSTRYRLDDLVQDHGHLVHLFLVRMPDMKSFWHLHPAQAGSAEFADNLPLMPAGDYHVYVDIAHATGIAETQVGTISLPAITGTATAGDDAGVSDLAAADQTVQLPDGYRMVWLKSSESLRAQQPNWFRFRIEDKNGKPATDLEPYMGMAGHAVFVSDDGKVFAHVHPAGSVSMAALSMAQGQPSGPDSSMTQMGGMSAMNSPGQGSEVTFPYGFPQPGNYHIFVQIKRAGQVETGSFAAHVEK